MSSICHYVIAYHDVGAPGKEKSLDDFQHLDSYALLGVSPGVTPDELKQAYRREIAKYHPDRFRTADPQTQQYARERTQRLTEAYAALTRGSQRRVQPMAAQAQPAANNDQLATKYDQALHMLATGRPVEAAAILRQIQRVDPFYRDVDDLLAEAETARAAGRTRRVPALWLGVGALGLLAVLGAGYAWRSSNSTDIVQQPTAGASVVVVEQVATVTTTSVSAAAEASPLSAFPTVPSAPAAGSGENEGPNEVLPTASSVSTEAVPTEVPVPTEAAATAAPTVVAARPPTQPVVALESGQVLVGDSFSDASSGWAILQEQDYTLGYRDNAYAITAGPNVGTIFSFGAPLAQGDVVIGADVTPVRGSAGLIFGADNTYRFLISGDGRFRVEQRTGIVVGPTASRAIRAGTNRLVIAAVGRRASLYANGVLLTNLDMPTPLLGTTYGFVVVAGSEGGEGVFDALTVRSLPR